MCLYVCVSVAWQSILADDALCELVKEQGRVRFLRKPANPATDEALAANYEVLKHFIAANARCNYELARVDTIRDVFFNVKTRLQETRWRWTCHVKLTQCNVQLCTQLGLG